MSRTPRTISVNEAFRPQRITGQQRYAVEISDRLLASADVRSVRPRGPVAGSGLATWAWTMSALPVITAADVLLTLTSRAPVVHPRHVVVVHDLFVITNPEWYSKKYVLSHVPLLKANLRTAKAIVAVSEPVARQVRESGLTDAPVTVAPNAPSPVFGLPATASGEASTGGAGTDILERHSLRADEYLLAVGSMDPRKNLPRLVEAYAALPESVRASTPLVVVGGGNAVFGDVDVQWPEGTVLTGYVSDEELAALYADARGVLFPSLAEGFGLPVVEALVAGARLAVSDIEVFRWIGGDSLFYFDPLSVDSIRAGMTALIEGTAPTPSASAVDEVRARFDWDRSAAVVLDVCRSVAAGRPLP